MNNLVFPFKNDKYQELIKRIGWDSLEKWINFCEEKQLISTLESFSENNFKYDWIWGVLFPLLSQAYSICIYEKTRKIIGISALPGTGKSTLGLLIEKLSLKLNIKIASISIDDFYLPRKEMLIAVNNNPWGVSRGYPGTHDTELMKEKLNNWKKTGLLNVPTFDKSINSGLGDRSIWKNVKADLLIIEGWFLGVKPFFSKETEDIEINPPISSHENIYRTKIQNNLEKYVDIWKFIDILWHLKPEKFNYLNLWKIQQEKEMLLKKGISLSDKKLDNFLRMLNVSLPQNSFNKIKSEFLFLIDQERKLINLTLK